MADILDIYKVCGNCKGTGIITINDLPHDEGPPTEDTCDTCNGTGELLWGEAREYEP